MRKNSIISLAICLVMAMGSAFADQLVANGGFETNNGVATTSGGVTFYVDFPGWTKTGTDVKDTVMTGSWGGFNPLSGSSQAVFGACDLTCTGLDPGGIEQTLATTSTNTYNVSFWLGNDSGTQNEITVSLGGLTLLTLSGQSSFGWTFYQFKNLSVGNGAILNISASNVPGYFHVDDVSVSTAPEPASLTLLGSGLLGLAGVTRRKFLNR